MRQRMLSYQHRLEVERRRAGATNLSVGQAPPPPPPAASPAEAAEGMVEQLRQLAKLRDAGVLTEEEFTAQKRRLLGS